MRTWGSGWARFCSDCALNLFLPRNRATVSIQDTFRAIILRTKYQQLREKESVYKVGDAEHLCFYFILKGSGMMYIDAVH